MRNLQDMLVGKLALRRDLVDPLTLQDCLADQKALPGAPLGQVLVRRRVISPAQLLELMKAAELVQLQCGACAASFRQAELPPQAGLACPRCGGTLRILFEGLELSDRFTTGRSAKALRPPPPRRGSDPPGRPPSSGANSPMPTPWAGSGGTRQDSSGQGSSGRGSGGLAATRPDSQQPGGAEPPAGPGLEGSVRFRLGSDNVQAGTGRFRGALIKAGAGTFFGPYEIVDELGRGGMGVVYKARQPNVDRFVALKVLLSGALASSTQVKRFQREAEVTARLKHPGIVHVHDVGQVQDFQYFTMDFVDGPPLSKLIKERQLGVRRAVEIARDVARALAHAHEKEAIHRDVKPGNIIMGKDGAPVLTDFGLARDLEGDERLTRSGAMVGTPYYMPPEQAQGKRDQVTGQADVYSLGVVLFEMLTFELPFRGETQLELTNKILDQEPPRPSEIEPTIDRDLETIVLKAMAKLPQERHATAGDLADDLDRYLRGERVRTRGDALTDLVRRARRGWRRPAAVAAAGGLLIVAALITSRSAVARAAIALEGAERDAAAFALDLAATRATRERAEQEAHEARRREVLDEALEAVRQAERAPAGEPYRRAVDVALERLSAAVDVLPDDVGLRLQRARLASRRGQADLARRDLEAARRLDPDGPGGAEAVALLVRFASRATSDEEAYRAAAGPLLAEGLAQAGPQAGAWRDVVEAMLLFVRDSDPEGALSAIARAQAKDASLAEVYTVEATLQSALGQPQVALRACDRALQLDAKAPHTWIVRARLHMVMGDAQGALDDVNRALELDPGLEAALLVRATIHQATRDYEAAIKDVRVLLERRGDDLETLLVLAQLYGLADRAPQADALLARVEALAPHDPRPWLMRTSRHLERRNMDDVLLELRRGLKAMPDTPAAVAGRKQLHDMFRRLGGGGGFQVHLREHALEVLAERPDDPQAGTLLAEALWLDDRNDEALARLATVLQRTPDHLPARELRLQVAFREQPREEALQELERYSAWAQGKAAALAGLARVHAVVLRDLERAQAVAQQALALDDEQAHAHMILGYVAAELEDFPRAQRALRKAVALAPDDPEVLSMAGVTAFNLGALDEAQALLNQAVSLDPLRSDALEGLSLIFVKHERWRDCVAFGRLYLTLFVAARRPPPVGLVLNVCEAHTRLGQHDRVIGLLQELVRAVPHADFKVRLARAYADTGQREPALALLDEVLAVEPDHPVARGMRAQLGRSD